MTIDEKRKTMKAFCKSTGCKRCPVRVIWDELCMEYKMENAPESLIEKAYVLAFGKVKEGNQMNITADEIRKVGWWESWTTSRYYGMDLDGEPIYRDGRIYYCSECGHKSIIKHNYCPYCGRKMEGQHEN